MAAEAGQALIARAGELAERVLWPRAEAADQAAGPPLEQIQALAEAGLLGLTVPEEYGGQSGSGETVRGCLEAVASGCGVTVFLYFQHVGGCRHLALCVNEELKQELLPQFSSGRKFCTLAFSHLRRPGSPAVRVERDGDAYVFHGEAPWTTGWGLSDEVLLAGTLEDGNTLWVMAPAVESETLIPSEPMRLCAASASATVSLTLRGHRVGEERFVKIMSQEQLAVDTANAILHFTALSLGVTRGSIRLIRQIVAERRSPTLADTAEQLEGELAATHAAVAEWAARTGEPDYAEHALRVRAWSIDLGVRAAHAAVAAGSGASNRLDHPAQRLFREAMLYTLTAQTRDLQTATLRQLQARAGQRGS